MATPAPDSPSPQSVVEPRRVSCPRCRRPPRVCYCSALPAKPLATTNTHVLILQHQHEKRHRNAISSVPVLAHVLANVTVVSVSDESGGGPGVDDQLDSLLYNANGDGRDSAYESVLILFPDATAKTLNGELLASLTLTSPSPSSLAAASRTNQEALSTPRILLVAIDGTWTEAKKIVFHNRMHFETLAQQRRSQGLHFEYVCLEADSGVTQSIYGDLRREPMEGCLSTLEAVASALLVLEPAERNVNRDIRDALLTGFQAMVQIQDQFMQKGKQAKLEMYNGVSKAEAIQQRNSQKKQQRSKTESDTRTADAAGCGVESADANEEDVTRRREYVFFTTHTDFRQRKQLQQHGSPLTCTYTEAREKCQELNRDRKRGQRLAVLPLEHFLRQRGDHQPMPEDR